MTNPSTTTTLHDIIREISEIDTELGLNIETTMWISDPHGAGDRFVSILRGRFGMVWRICRESLPKTFSDEKIEYIGRIIRKEKYFTEDHQYIERQDVISALVKIIQYRVQNSRHFDNIRKTFNSDLRLTIENLILNYPVPDIIYENPIIADRLISLLCKIVKQVILGRLVVLGDVFDRGDEPDKIFRILSNRIMRPYVSFIWGNHDILWMGAAAGNRSLIAEALRISTRYDNLAFLQRLGIDIGRLIEFAKRLYPGEISGNFKAKLDISKKMEKTLALIQFKLEEKTIREHPGFHMDSRLWLDRFALMLKNNDCAGLTDTDFPTLDLDNPTALTPEEADIIDDLADQLTRSEKIRSIMRFLFEQGRLYDIDNYIMNLHALIPSTADGEFDELMGYRGKALFDYIEAAVKNVGTNYLDGREQDSTELALMFYLWCGPKSPMFGKDAMKTFERYFFKDKATHKETTLYWGKNIVNPAFMDKVATEFNARRVVYGHTPVDISKGEPISSPDGRAINVDGGFSDAYLSRGHSLILTPYSLYAIILPTPDEVAEARKKLEPVKLKIETIDTFENPIKVKNTPRGAALKNRREQLYAMLSDCANGS